MVAVMAASGIKPSAAGGWYGGLWLKPRAQHAPGLCSYHLNYTLTPEGLSDAAVRPLAQHEVVLLLSGTSGGTWDPLKLRPQGGEFLIPGLKVRTVFPRIT